MSYVVLYRNNRGGCQLFGCATLAQVHAFRVALGWDVTESRVATTLERADWRRCLGVAS